MTVWILYQAHTVMKTDSCVQKQLEVQLYFASYLIQFIDSQIKKGTHSFMHCSTFLDS